MFLIVCPNCGPRDQSEFANRGEVRPPQPEAPEKLSDAEWADYVFMRANTKGVLAERWFHAAGCRRFFCMLRNTATDEILATYRMSETPPKVTSAGPATPSGEAPIGSGNDAAKVMRPEEVSS